MQKYRIKTTVLKNIHIRKIKSNTFFFFCNFRQVQPTLHPVTLTFTHLTANINLHIQRQGSNVKQMFVHNNGCWKSNEVQICFSFLYTEFNVIQQTTHYG